MSYIPNYLCLCCGHVLNYIEADAGICAVCGNEDGGKMEIHHIRVYDPEEC